MIAWGPKQLKMDCQSVSKVVVQYKLKAKGVPGNARARLPARPRAENRAIWQNQVPVARTSVTGHARAHPLPGL